MPAIEFFRQGVVDDSSHAQLHAFPIATMARKSPPKLTTIIGDALPSLPWQARPKNNSDVVWRYSANPIIPRNAMPTSNSIFNSAVVPFKGAFAGVFRCDDRAREMNIHAGFSDDGIHWKIDPQPIELTGDDPEVTRFAVPLRPARVLDRRSLLRDAGATAITARPSAWATPTISRRSTSLRTPFCPSTATACCSRARSTASTPCSAGPATTATPPSATSSTAKART